MLVKTLSGTLHFIGKNDKTVCGLGIRESWASSDNLIFDAEDVCEKCQELFDEEESDFVEDLVQEKGEIEKDEPAKGFKI